MLFDLFDRDGSGTIDAEEIGELLSTLGISFDEAQMEQLLLDADVDGSGAIEFAEFEAAVAKQQAAGGGGADASGLGALALDVGQRTFSWFDPGSWFAPAPPQEEPSQDGNPVRSKHSVGPGRYYARPTVAPSEEFTPTHRMKLSQGVVQEENWRTAQTMRDELIGGKAMEKQRGEGFAARQQLRVAESRYQAQTRQQAVEALRQQKLQTGEMVRQNLDKFREMGALQRGHHAATGRRRLLAAKWKHEEKMVAQAKRERKKSQANALKSRTERSHRKEMSKATIRAEEQAAKDQAARVRFETRPEVRQDARDLFYTQRSAVAQAEKEQQIINEDVIADQRARYIAKQHVVRAQVGALHASARHARDALSESRRQQAMEMRKALVEERERKKNEAEKVGLAKREMHDQIYTWNKAGSLQPGYDFDGDYYDA